MSKKYRIRLTSRRILGPYVLSDIQKLFKNSKLNGDEFYQYYPVGEWQNSSEFPELNKLFSQNKSQIIPQQDSKDTVVKMTLTNEDDSFIEFNYKRSDDSEDNDKNQVDIETRKENKDTSDVDLNSSVSGDSKIDSDNLINTKEDLNTDNKSDLEKTQVINIKNFQQSKNISDDVQKTQLNTNFQELLKQEEKEKQIALEKSKKEESERLKLKDEKESSNNEIITYEDKTQVLNLKELMPEINKEIKKTEKEEKELFGISEDNEEEDEGLLKNTIKRKGTKPIVLICMLAIIYMLMFDEDKGLPLKPLYVTLSTPIVKPVLNILESKKLYNIGVKQFNTNHYVNIVKSYGNFKKSIENNFNNDKAFGKLILSSAMIFNESKNEFKSAQIVFEMLQMKDSLKIKNEDYVLGASLFFRKLKKYKTSLYYLDNYLRIKKKLTAKLLNEYITVLLYNGNFDTVKRFVDNLKKIKKPTVEGYLNLALYYNFNLEYKKEYKILSKAIREYPRSVSLYLRVLDSVKKNNQFKKIEKILAIVKELKADNRPTFFAKFYEYLGYHFASKTKIKKATVFFKKSLQIVDSDELRSRLASLEVTGKEAQRNLIYESKVVTMMIKIKKFVKQKKWLKAFKLAIEAVDLYPGYIPSGLLLANIQIKRGYFNEAIKIIKDLRENYPMNSNINFTYIDTFIESGKLSEANIEINLLGAKRKLSQTWKYASYLAKYYSRSNNFLLSINWLMESLSRNPLNSNDYFNLAEIFYKNNRFKKSKYYLNKALFLEPKEMRNHILYSKILYELEGIDTAIGYLRHLLKSNPNNIELLSGIAIFYYKDGKLKDFKEMKADIEKLNLTDPNFYRFLIKSARISDNNGELIKHSYKLAEYEPSDIKNKVELGQYLLIENRLTESIKVFNDILTRLPSYPRVHYFISKIYLKQNNLEKALEEALLEIKHNKSIYYGYFVAGEAYKRMGKFGLAIRNLEKALAIDRRVIETLKSLAWIRSKQNFMNQALEFYKMANRLDPNEPDIHKNLGDIYQRVGQRKLAAQEFSTYLRLYPNAPDQRHIQGLIRSLNNN